MCSYKKKYIFIFVQYFSSTFFVLYITLFIFRSSIVSSFCLPFLFYVHDFLYLPLSILIIFLNWSIVALHCCVSFCWHIKMDQPYEYTWMKSKVSRSVVSDSLGPYELYPVHGILQARILEWGAIPFSWGSFPPRDQPRFPTLQADSSPFESTGKPMYFPHLKKKKFFPI